MTSFRAVLFLVCAIACAGRVFGAAEWLNIDEDHYLGGRKCSPGYLLNKVTLVSTDVTMFPRMEEIWTSFKTKQFVLIGSYAKAPKNVSFPVYREASLKGAAESPVYVVDETGRVRYRGQDERKATETIVMLLTDMDAPKNETQWKMLLDYEFEFLPGQAYLRYRDYKKKLPASAKAYEGKYAELIKIKDIKKLAELVEFAKKAKDHRAFDPKKAKLQKSRLLGKINEVIAKYASLKESENPLVVQEAKNALADLAWAKAGL